MAKKVVVSSSSRSALLQRSTETVNNPQFDLNKLVVKERLGQGSFSNVFTAMFKAPGSEETETVVVKKNE